MTFSSEDSRCGRNGVGSSSKTKSGDRPHEHGNLFNNSVVNMAFGGHLRDGHGAETGLDSGAKTKSASEGYLFSESQIPESFSQVSQPDPYLNRLLSDLLSQEEPDYFSQLSELESSFLPNAKALVAVGPGYEGSHADSLEEKCEKLEDDSTLCKRYHGTGTWRCASIALEGAPYCEKHYNDIKKRLVSKQKKTSGSVKSTEEREHSQKRKCSNADSSGHAESKQKPKLNSNTGKIPRCVPPKQSSSWYDNVVHGPPRFSQLLTQASQSKPSQQPKTTQTVDDGIRKYFRSEVPLDLAKVSETAITAKDENKGAILLVGETNLREQILEHMLASTETRPSRNLPNNSKVHGPNHNMIIRGPSTDDQKSDVKEKSGETRFPNFVESALSEGFSQASRPDRHSNLLSNPQIDPGQHMAFSSPDVRHGRTGVERTSKTKSADRQPDQRGNLFNNNPQVFLDHMAFSSQDFHRGETGVESGAKTKSGEGPPPIFTESQIPESFSQLSPPEEPEYLTQFSELECGFLPTVNAIEAVRPRKESHGVSLEDKPHQLESYSTLCKWLHEKGWRCASTAIEGHPYCEKHLNEIKKRGLQPEAKPSQEDALRVDSEQDSLPVNIDSPCPLWSEHAWQAVQTKFSPLKKHPQNSNSSKEDVRCEETCVGSDGNRKPEEGGPPIIADSQIAESFSQVSQFELRSLNMPQLSNSQEPERFNAQFSKLEGTILPTANAQAAVGPYEGSQALMSIFEEKPKQLEAGSTLCKICHGRGWRCANCMALEGQPYCERYCNDVCNDIEGVSKPKKTLVGSLNFKSTVHAKEESQKRQWSYGNSSGDKKDSEKTPNSNSNSDFVAEVEKVWSELQELSQSDNLESEILRKILEQSAGLRLPQCRLDNRQSSVMNKMGTEQLRLPEWTEVPTIGDENEPGKISS